MLLTADPEATRRLALCDRTAPVQDVATTAPIWLAPCRANTVKPDTAQSVPRYITPSYQTAVQTLSAAIAGWHQAGATVIGLSGAQGTGKSTLSTHLIDALAERHGLRACMLSLDDLYLPHAARVGLARRVHPLFVTRGVPGTHDPSMGLAVIQTLLGAQPSTEVALPRFIKAIDDRAPLADWHRVLGPIDLVLFEGWCLGVGTADCDEPGEPINPLEASEDADSIWRDHIEAELAGPYRELFERIDRLVFLQIPAFALVKQWRGEQEQANAREVEGARPMSEAELDRFIQHYERLTQRALAQLPDQCDALVSLAADHHIEQIDIRS